MSAAVELTPLMTVRTQARAAFKSMRREGLSPTTETCNALLGAIAQEAADGARSARGGAPPNPDAALKVFVRYKQLLADGSLEAPDLVTYNVLLKVGRTSTHLHPAASCWCDVDRVYCPVCEVPFQHTEKANRGLSV